MRGLDCFFRGIYRSVRYKHIIDGHNHKLIYESDDAYITKCEYCGKYEVGFMKEELWTLSRIIYDDAPQTASKFFNKFKKNT